MLTSVAIAFNKISLAELAQLAVEMPLWLPSSLVSSERVADLRAATPFTITTFDVPPGVGREDLLRTVVWDVEQHHNQESQIPPYRVLLVFGVSLNQSILDCLKGLGFVRFESTAFGFKAEKAT